MTQLVYILIRYEPLNISLCDGDSFDVALQKRNATH